MTKRTFHHQWEWDLEPPPTVLWPFVADTNRFNRDIGLGIPARRQRGSELPNARHHVAARNLLGQMVEWDEEPFEWVEPHRYSVRRFYQNGPVSRLDVMCTLEPNSTGGTHLTYGFITTTRNWVGRRLIPFQMGVLARRFISRVFERLGQAAAQQQALPVYTLSKTDHLDEAERARLETMHQTVVEQGGSDEVIRHLGKLIRYTDTVTLARLRPYVLADAWELPRRTVLETFLLATRVGLLEFQWDLLCPLCRGAKGTSNTLSGVRADVHCETCNIDFTVNFDRSVELTFRPTPLVRAVDRVDYCVGGPFMTPHIAIHQLMPPGDERTVEPFLSPGSYRLRTLNKRGGQYFRVEASGQSAARLAVDDGEWPEGETVIASDATLQLVNGSSEERLLVLERMVWAEDATLAADVTSLQRFRDLFASEALRPGEQIAVGSLSLLFTDLRQSTQMYQHVGDAPAFGMVMAHFDVLRDAIDAENGAIVKTIGDAVMASFRNPLAALRAILRAQDHLISPGVEDYALTLKAGIHHGPCIAVTLNDRLDYFGSNVNIASRLEGLSSGRDVIISDAVYQDPEVAAWLAAGESGFVAEPFESTLKGYGEAQFNLWRVRQT